MKLNLNEMQSKVLHTVHGDHKDTTILATGAGSGQSYIANLLPFILSEDVIILTTGARDSNYTFNFTRHLLTKIEMDYEVSQNPLQIKTQYASLRIVSSVSDLKTISSNTIIVVDRPQHNEIKELRLFFRRNKMLIMTQPIHCGWRNPEYDMGLIKLNSKGTDMLTTSESWDSWLVNWRPMTTRAKVSDYKSGVNIITNSGIEDNLSIYNTSYILTVDGLHPKHKNKLGAYWIC